MEDSDLPDKKKSALRDKLDELEEELAKQRLSFARTMAIAASIMTCLGGGAAFVAKLPEAGQSIIKIIQWVGEDKEKEESERLRLMPPPKALPDLSARKQVAGAGFGFDEFDDNVPF